MDGETKRLIKLRDPMQVRERFSSQLIGFFPEIALETDELKRKLKYDAKKDNDIFLLDFGDYVSKFRSTVVCY